MIFTMKNAPGRSKMFTGIYLMIYVNLMSLFHLVQTYNIRHSMSEPVLFRMERSAAGMLFLIFVFYELMGIVKHYG